GHDERCVRLSVVVVETPAVSKVLSLPFDGFKDRLRIHSKSFRSSFAQGKAKFDCIPLFYRAIHLKRFHKCHGHTNNVIREARPSLRQSYDATANRFYCSDPPPRDLQVETALRATGAPRGGQSHYLSTTP
ncbi:hypothetical protein J6590_094301, partial [Homalodisca vitripennis]